MGGTSSPRISFLATEHVVCLVLHWSIIRIHSGERLFIVDVFLWNVIDVGRHDFDFL